MARPLSRTGDRLCPGGCVHGPPDSGLERDLSGERAALVERVDVLTSQIRDLEAELRASTVAGDAKTLKELAKALDAWSKHDPKLEQRVTTKVEGLGDRITILTQRLETLATTVATTASGLAGREGEVAALRRRVDEQNAAFTAGLADLGAQVDPKPLLDLKETVRTLAGEARTLKRNLQRLTDGTTNSTDQLASRIEALGSTVSAGAAVLASREQEIAQLRAAFEDLLARTEATVVRVAARENDAATLTAALTEHESALTELRTAVNGTSTQVDSAVAEFRRSVNALASRVTRLDEVLDPDAVRGLEDRLVRLGATSEDSARRLASVEVEARATAERETNNEAEVAVLREHVEVRQGQVDSAIRELRESVAGLTSRLSAVDDVASGETARRLEEHVGVARKELENLTLRVETLAAGVDETHAHSEAKAAEIEALALRFDQARTRVEALIGDLREALDTMPTSSAPDPALVEGLNEVTGRVGTFGARLEQLERYVREHAESAASRDGELERGVTDSIGRLVAVERDQAERAVETSRIAEQSAAEFARVRQQLEGLEASHTESAQAIERVGLLLEKATARLDGSDRERGSVVGEIARISSFVEGEMSTLRHELDGIRGAVAQLQEVPVSELASAGGRLAQVESDLAARAAEVSHVMEISASERLWVRQQLEALASAQAKAARADTELVPLVDELTARVDVISRERQSAAGDAARMSELIAAERSLLHGQLEALAATLTEQMSRRGDRSEALGTELVGRLDALERAGVAATSEIERLAALHSAELASVEARLAETLTAALSDRVSDLAGRVVSPDGSGAVGARSTPDASDGRLRVELRSLGLRMEHAEASAKESQEAVLLELERLASRLERLESTTGDAADELQDVGGLVGDVVPIRGDA